MDARPTSVDRRRRQTPINRRRHELDTWLHACDICVDPATNPVAAPCGHLFCSSCLDGAFLDGLARQNACPICDAELPEETAQNSSLISEARMTVVQDMIDEEIECTHTMRVDLIRYSSNLKAQRIRGLEQAFETVVQINVDLLREMEVRDEENRRLRREMEDREEDNRGLRRRIAELENPIAGASSNALGMNSMRHRRFGRRITPTPVATRAFVTVTEEQPIPVRESVEGGSSSMNSQAGA